MGFAILRITEAGNVIDSTFERNYQGCTENSIPVGVYKYSYAMTVSEIQSEAKKVVSVLAGRKIQFPVFLDLENNNQRALGSENIHKLADAFRDIIEKAGYKFALYCNVDWYDTVICSHLKKYDFWIARYPANDNGTLQERLQPDFGVGWQYSSKGKVSGISGNVDMDVFYKDYRETTQKGETKMVKISNCGHDENGRYAGGKAGDQTGTEYQIMNWYSRPWLCVLRFNDAKIAAMIADMATKAARNNLIGYDQGTAGNNNDRYSFWQHLKASNYDPAQITVACESDCSASTAAIVKGAGYRLNNAKLKAVSIYLTTRNMRTAMKAAGAKVLTDSKYLTSGDYLKAGDILLNDNHHVAIAVTTGAKVSTPSTTLTGTFQTRLPILRKGSSGTAVAMLQAMLGVEVDGQFGNDTYNSLKVFQKNVGVKANGTCGIDTWKRVIEHMKANTK
nr:MAG TPA: hypothetical protein [Caudoviricetes sp.]